MLDGSPLFRSLRSCIAPIMQARAVTPPRVATPRHQAKSVPPERLATKTRPSGWNLDMNHYGIAKQCALLASLILLPLLI
eukprot:4471661-Amphidinium_carterae.1